LAITKEKKQELLAGYVDALKGSQAVVFVQSRGLNVAEATELRGKIRETGGKYSIVKNTLFRLALSQAEMPVPEAILGPIAVAFCPEDLAPTVKVIADFARELEDREFEIVGGIVDNEVLDGKRAEALASLPTKETLFAQILATMNAPATQVASVVAGGIRQVLNVLQARVDQLQEGEAAA
jgi:large subunit ribosomal protein L10